MWLALQNVFRELWTFTKIILFVLILLVAWGIAHGPRPQKPEAAVIKAMPHQLVAVFEFYTDNKSGRKTG